jgi:hypothetical protein
MRSQRDFLSGLTVLIFTGVLLLAVAVGAPSGWADTLTLKDGQVIQGLLVERTETAVKFKVGGVGGQELNFPMSAVQDISFGAPAAPAAQPAPAAPAPAVPAATQAGGSVTITAGTGLLVKMQSSVVTGKSKRGDPFITVLEKAVTVEGKTVFPKGTKVYGRVAEAVAAGRVRGQAKLIIHLDEIETGSGTVAINTKSHEFQGQRSGTLRKVAVGAAIGNIDNDNNRKKGGQEGAAYGGIVAVMTPGNQIAVNPGTLMEFVLSASVKVN